jgi:DNA-directed RNA polymerase subunit M/transcription elongation factor TFIIS
MPVRTEIQNDFLVLKCSKCGVVMENAYRGWARGAPPLLICTCPECGQTFEFKLAHWMGLSARATIA